MSNFLFVPVALAYLLIIGLLFLFGMYYFYIVLLAHRFKGDQDLEPEIDEWPSVTVQLPIFNEMYVAERLIRRAGQLDYPTAKLEIQVLDDSTDETRQIACKAVQALKAEGLNIQYLHREQREGFKAGALREGFRQASGEFLAIFDADFLPPKMFLRKTVPHLADPEIAFVQTRWGHINRNFSFLTYMQALTLDSHFIIEQFARSKAGLWFNFNGTAGVWRAKAIAEAGGWQAHTLTEDLDLSYRAFLKGWKAKYLRDVVVPA
ncbi:MAG: glycosyltransferase, partial [Anaerolineales bacterium]|nr:glycosyltransferase [Anaerolineales bacterium]